MSFGFPTCYAPYSHPFESFSYKLSNDDSSLSAIKQKYSDLNNVHFKVYIFNEKFDRKQLSNASKVLRFDLSYAYGSNYGNSFELFDKKLKDHSIERTKYNLFYQDEEGDWIELSNEDDLKHMNKIMSLILTKIVCELKPVLETNETKTTSQTDNEEEKPLTMLDESKTESTESDTFSLNEDDEDDEDDEDELDPEEKTKKFFLFEDEVKKMMQGLSSLKDKEGDDNSKVTSCSTNHVHKYQNELIALHGMGFVNHSNNVKFLNKNNGDIDITIADLIFQ